MSAEPTSPLVISIDCDPGLAPADLAGRRTIESAAVSLLDCLAELRIPATWAATHWNLAELGSRSAASAHELAILADSTWAGPAVTRTRLSNEWNARSAELRALGREAGSLVLRDGSLTEQLDLLVKFGVTAVRLPKVDGSAAPPRRGLAASVVSLVRSLRGPRVIDATPRPVRWGIWELPASLVLPAVSARQAVRSIDRAMASETPLHLVVDLPTCAFGRSSPLSMLERLLKHVARRASESRLELKTMTGIVADLAHVHQGRPSRSILRRTIAA